MLEQGRTMLGTARMDQKEVGHLVPDSAQQHNVHHDASLSVLGAVLSLSLLHIRNAPGIKLALLISFTEVLEAIPI